MCAVHMSDVNCQCHYEVSRCHLSVSAFWHFGLWLSAVVRRRFELEIIEKIKKFAARLQAAVAHANACVIFILFEFSKLLVVYKILS